MRKVTFGAACSLDHYIARADGSVDWLLWNDEVSDITSEFWKTVDTVVMGRKTYEAAAAAGMPAYPGVRNFVFSRTMQEEPDADVQVVRDDVAEFTRELKSQDGAGICVMGGGELAHGLFEADVIDEVGLNIHPVVLGAGVPLFLPMNRETPLDLLECRRLQNGCVYVLYRVIHREDS